MDFSAFNPTSSNSLNMAARHNKVAKLKKLLRTQNPNCVDNRGWTCLHEAAVNNYLECVKLILEHPDCRPLSETYEGHTALYLACRFDASLECIKYLLDKVEHIAQYASNEMVSPLHLACQRGNLQLVELLLQYDSIIDLEDFDGDTPLHDAVCASQSHVIPALLHAGVQPEKKNRMGFTPFHLACAQGCIDAVSHLFPFVTDINECSGSTLSTPLMLACDQGRLKVFCFLMSHGADPNKVDCEGESALMMALTGGHYEIFKTLLPISNQDCISKDIFLRACQPQFFNIDILLTLLESDLGPDFFNVTQCFFARLRGDDSLTYSVNLPLNYFFKVADYIYQKSSDLFVRLLYLLLMRGVSVDAEYSEECPPLVYLIYGDAVNCVDEVIRIMISQDCNIDYGAVPDLSHLVHLPHIIQTALWMGSYALPVLLTYSLASELELIIRFINESMTDLTSSGVRSGMRTVLFQLSEERRGIQHIVRMIIGSSSTVSRVPTLEHLCRLSVRKRLRDIGVKTTRQFLTAVNSLPLPSSLIEFLRYCV